MVEPIIIVGAGLAGWSTVRELRKFDANSPLVLITADSGDFYAKPSLSNAFAQKKSPYQLVTTPAAAMAEKLGVNLVPHTRVESIDTALQTVTTSKGVFSYSKLVLAVGARPIRAPVEGAACDHAVSVNSLDDFAVLHGQLQRDEGGGRSVVIMGAGLIGCEFANDLVTAGYRVSVVDPCDRPLAALLPQAAGEQLRDALSALGVSWHFGKTVKAIGHSAADAGARLALTLSDGTTLEADHVLSAIGLRADLKLAQAAGIACERGIMVDSFLRTSAANVYALGDCAQYAGSY